MIHKILCFLGLHSYAHIMVQEKIQSSKPVIRGDIIIRFEKVEEIVYVPVSRCIFCNKEV